MRSIRLLLCLGLALSAAPLGRAFSLLGPYEAWQVLALGYALPGDIGAPKNFDEGYRWNLPVITYAFDQSFLNYFGDRGVTEVEKAIAVFNNLPPFSEVGDDGSSLSINGLPVPLDTRMKNYEAGALGLFDLKSAALAMLTEEMGLAEPERWVWALRNAHVTTQGGLTWTNYTVIQYNFSPTKPYVQTPYVNGIYYTYTISKITGPPLTYEDPEETPGQIPGCCAGLPYSSVAGYNLLNPNGGEFFTGLTQDEVGGLRYLYNSSRLVVETLQTNAVLGSPIGASPWVPFFIPTNLISAPTNFANLGGTATTNGSNLVINIALRPGINKLQFQRVNFDSMLGNTFTPITNNWNDAYVTNGQLKLQSVQRVITQPDILFIVDDLGFTTFEGLPVWMARSSTTNWVNNDALNGYDSNVDGGPGTIEPPVNIWFSNRLPYFENYTGQGNYFVNGMSANADGQEGASRSAIWGSYDATTNAIVIYPQYLGITVGDLRAIAVKPSPW